MALRFKDRRGHYGVVSDTLDIDYSGHWTQEVRDVVREAKDASLEDPMAHLIIELGENAPLIEVSRDDPLR